MPTDRVYDEINEVREEQKIAYIPIRYVRKSKRLCMPEAPDSDI